MAATDTRRRWRVASVASATVAACAVLALAGWALSRPGDSAGDGVAALRAAGASATPGPTPASSGPAPTPSVRATARPAAPRDRTAAVAPPPTRLRIPALRVSAAVDPVGVQRDGAMVIPAATTRVGWYRYGSAPADPRGHVVIAGHVATDAGPGALARLAEAEPGMRVEVVDAEGTVHRYTVRGRQAIHKTALPVDEIFARDGRPVLVLVTCGGEYLPDLRSHRDNVIVTAVPDDP